MRIFMLIVLAIIAIWFFAGVIYVNLNTKTVIDQAVAGVYSLCSIVSLVGFGIIWQLKNKG